MKEISKEVITNSVYKLIDNACHNLNDYTFNLLKEKYANERNTLAKEVLSQIIENATLAKNEHIPMCQDTGIVNCFVELGYDVHLKCDLYEAINEGVSKAYKELYLRKSVADAITRKNTLDNTPAIIHVKLVKGDKLKIKIAPKGAGSENMSKIKMLNPTDGIKGIKDFVINTIKEASGKPCPPIFVGVGIGGNFEKCAIMAKEAILREESSSDLEIRKLEDELTIELNNLNIGPMGLGGDTTCFRVFINTMPCHIASLPVAICIQCHASRHEEVVL